MEYIVWLLGSLVVFQQVFWAFQVHRLVDKVMSKSYYDYELSRGLSDPKPLPKMEEYATEQIVPF